MSSAEMLLARIPAREWRGLVPAWQGGRLQIALECHECGTTDHWSATQMISPQATIPKIIQLGWDVNGKLTCPKCIEERRLSRRGKGTVDMSQKVVMIDNAQEAGKKNKRLVILALEDYFDEASRRYRDGKSDKSVADELSLSDTFVAKVREEFYGPLGEPEEVIAFRSELSALRARVEEMERMLTSMTNRNGWKV